MNRLSKENSPYLRHAATQKINWYPWCDEAFEKARIEGKPVFLSSGAVWCHWCHVMAKESFEDDEVAELLNKNFICIKLDRDERPDIDRRYQRAVAAMGGGGGWPLSVFLTHDKKPFYGGTYFPLNEQYGMLGFKTLLKAINELYKAKKDEVIANSTEIVRFLKTDSTVIGEINPEIINNGVRSILNSIDKDRGGFGYAPKFPMPGSIEFLLGNYFLKHDEDIGVFLKKTLYSMAKGGIYDQLTGGFHRYSTDAHWIIPHFEKMLDDNVWLLKNYIDAYCIFNEDLLRDVAYGIMGFIKDELSHEDGGFYASQDADVTPEDEGGYFTWSKDEFKDILDEDEFRVLSAYFLHDGGILPHNFRRMVLYIEESIEDLARKISMPVQTFKDLIERGKKKLLKERQKRQKPFIDKTLYTSLNSMAASIFLEAYMIFKDEDIKRLGLMTIDRILRENIKDDILFHSPGVKAMLDDYIYLVDALVTAYEITGENNYICKAKDIMDTCIERLWDKETGGFFDSEDDVIGIKIKAIDDGPHPSPNSLAIVVLIKLSVILKDGSYKEYAELAMKAFSAQAQDMGVHAGYFYNAINFYFYMLEFTIQRGASKELKDEVYSLFYPYKVIRYEDDGDKVVPCFGATCYEPIQKPEAIKGLLKILPIGK